MSMKHPERIHQAADKKRRLNRAAQKDAIRERRARLAAERARKNPPKKDA
jgi:hypothetical protein